MLRVRSSNTTTHNQEIEMLSVRTTNTTTPNQEIQSNREAGAIDNRSGDSRVEPGPFMARVPGRKGHKEMVSRLGLEPRALALKGRTRMLRQSVMKNDGVRQTPGQLGVYWLSVCDGVRLR